MKIRSITQFAMLAGTMAYMAITAGCGGGGGGGNGPSTIVSGTASKGIIFPGTVKLYGVDANGAKGITPLANVATDSNGKYMANLGSYAGPLVVEVSGDYTDEATGSTMTISPAAPLHAVVDAVDTSTNNNRTVAITPLTDLAYSLAGTTLTRAAVAAANNRVGELFKIDDIIATEPVRSDPVFMGGSGVSAAQQAYTMALVTLSQMAKNAAAGAPASFDQIKTLLDSFRTDMSASATAGLSTANMTAFATALASVSTSPAMSGFGTAASILSSVGTPIFKLTLAAGNVPAGVRLGTLRATLSLPAGVSIRAGNDGQVLANLIVPTGTAVTGTVLVMGNYQAAASSLVIGIVTTAGFAAGDCAVVSFDVAAGATVTPANFLVTLDEAKDDGPTYSQVAGVTVSLK